MTNGDFVFLFLNFFNLHAVRGNKNFVKKDYDLLDRELAGVQYSVHVRMISLQRFKNNKYFDTHLGIVFLEIQLCVVKPI